MKYVAFLRGINVGGNNIIKMTNLKEIFEKNLYRNVLTYIQSGNVIFEQPVNAPEKNKQQISLIIEKFLSKKFNYKASVILRSLSEMKKILKDVPANWEKKQDIRCYLGFIKEPTNEKDVIKEIRLNKSVDSVKISPGVIYMTTILSGLTKSGFNKLASTKIYKEITIRNYNTAQKILTLMEKRTN